MARNLFRALKEWETGDTFQGAKYRKVFNKYDPEVTSIKPKAPNKTHEISIKYACVGKKT
jgi:hypothetical protein